ncbi:MAG: MbnP family protein [Bacteroidota bacterium]
MKSLIKKTVAFCSAILFLFSFFTSCKQDSPPVVVPKLHALTINFNHYFGNAPLQFLTNYITAANDTIKIKSQFEYYISNVKLTTTDGQVYAPETYFLIHYDIDSQDPAAASIQLQNIPNANFTKLSFLIGVDSLHNHTLGQTGALDPANGMVWTWNVGYIFYRLMGSFSSANTSFSFDLGVDENLMKYELPASIQMDNNRTVNLKMDLKELFQTPNVYDLKVDNKDIHSTTAPGLLKLIPNSKDMMTLISVQ